MPLVCEDIIRQQLNRSMSEEEILDFAREGSRLARRAKAAQAAAGRLPDVQALARDYARRRQLAALAKKRAEELQAAARLRNFQYAMDKFKGMEWEGLSALMVGGKYLREGHRLSVDAMRGSLAGRYAGGLITDLEKLDKNYVRILRDDVMSRHIAEALWDLDKKTSAWSGPAQAMDIAKIVHKWQELAREDENRAGAWINKIPGYICRQSHDPAKLKAAGYENWKQEIQDKLDWERTAGGRLETATAGERDAFLYECWLGLVSGMHQKYTPPGMATPPPNPGSRSSLGTTAAKASQERVLHFATGGQWFDYNRKFGNGPLAEAILSGLQKSANDTALMRMFGPSPMANLEAMINDLKMACRARGDHESIARISAKTRRLRNEMMELDGSLNTEGDPRLATVGRAVRALQSMSKLGGALLSGFSDIPLFAQEMKYQGRSWFASMAQGLALFAKGRGSLEERAILSQCGVFFDSMCGNLTSRFIGQDFPGKMTALMNTFFRLNGLSFWTDAWKKSACLMMAHDLARLSGSAFNQLSRQRQRMLSLYNIDADIWDLIRSGKMAAADGRAYLTADAVTSIPASRIEACMSSKGMLTSAERVEDFRETIAERIRSMYKDRVQYAILEPDARTQAMLHQGLSAGTVTGEALRFVTQFKSFPFAFIQRVFGREIYGRGSDTALRGLGNAVIPYGGELSGLCGMILATTAFGYLSMCAKSLLAGKTVRDFTESPEQFGKVFLAALVQGGGAGLYGDFLLGEKSRMGDDFLSSLAGPALGSLSSLVSLYKSARDGEDVRSTAFRTLWSHIPGNNLFWIRTALNQMLLYSFREWLDPGSVRRLHKKVERETGQRFWLEPHVWDWAY